MKKTLVALAVLAASGASFAQVAITGTYSFGYRADTSKTGAASSGLGIDTSALNFTATEDLGGGTKVTAVMSFDGLNRAAANGGDSSVAIATPYGTFKGSLARGADYLSGGTAGVAGFGLDGLLFSALWAGDAVSYTSPAFSNVVVSVTHEEITPTAETAAQGVGIGAGFAGAYPATYQRRTGLGFKYSAAPLVVDGAYQTYDQQGVAPAVDNTATGTLAPNFVSRTRLSGSYDFGVVKLGAGIDSRQLTSGSRVDSLIGAYIPFGAANIGVEFGTRKYDGTGQGRLDGTRNGSAIVANYNLSKRTSVQGFYVKYDAVTLNSVNSTNQSSDRTEVQIVHSF
jgi:Gram-negative porin